MESSGGVRAYCAALALASAGLVAWALFLRLPQAQKEIDALEDACHEVNPECYVTEPRVLRRLGDIWARRLSKGGDALQGKEVERYLQITDDDAYLCSEDSTTGVFRAIDLNCHARLRGAALVSDASRPPRCTHS